MFNEGGGHFGRDKTLEKNCSRFYWRDMAKHIKEYVSSCEVCQKTNPKLHKEVPVYIQLLKSGIK